MVKAQFHQVPSSQVVCLLAEMERTSWLSSRSRVAGSYHRSHDVEPGPVFDFVKSGVSICEFELHPEMYQYYGDLTINGDSVIWGFTFDGRVVKSRWEQLCSEYYHWTAKIIDFPTCFRVLFSTGHWTLSPWLGSWAEAAALVQSRCTLATSKKNSRSAFFHTLKQPMFPNRVYVWATCCEHLWAKTRVLCLLVEEYLCPPGPPCGVWLQWCPSQVKLLRMSGMVNCV